MNMRGGPKVTVLMSVYNGERYLNEAVDSILSQTFTDFEFLIIDDASTDRTPEILRSYDDPRIRVVTNEENLGLTKSLNKGLALAKGEYIARMDADDISLPERFEKQIKFLENHPNVALVGTSCQVIDHQNKALGYDFVQSDVLYEDLIKRNCIHHGSIIVRRSVMNEFSGYNELFRKCQDYALWLQMIKLYQLKNIPEILYKLRSHSNSVSRIGNESIYYRILAIRIAECSISEELVEEISSSDISCLYKYLTESEWIQYCSFMASKYRSEGDFKRARQEYLKIFKLKPLDILSLTNAFRMCLGSRVISVTSVLYSIPQHLQYHLILSNPRYRQYWERLFRRNWKSFNRR